MMKFKAILIMVMAICLITGCYEDSDKEKVYINQEPKENPLPPAPVIDVYNGVDQQDFKVVPGSTVVLLNKVTLHNISDEEVAIYSIFIEDYTWGNSVDAEIKNLQLTIVFDNYQSQPELQTGHGFACYVSGLDNDLLFDTGVDGQVLLSNMASLKFESQTVKSVVLSHIHGDHVGGLNEFLTVNANVKVYLPAVFPASFKNQVKQTGAQVIEIQEFKNLNDNFYTSGVLNGGIAEQSLIITTKQGLVVLTGCAHPGIVNILKHVKDQLEQPILLAMGGFHLGGYSQDQLQQLIAEFKDLGVKYVAPCHFSGDLARQLFKEQYGENYLEVGVGKSIKINELK